MPFDRYIPGRLAKNEIDRLRTSVSNSLNKDVVRVEPDPNAPIHESLLSKLIDETPTITGREPRLVLSLYKPNGDKGALFNLDYDGQVLLIFTDENEAGQMIRKQVKNRLNGTYDAGPISYHDPVVPPLEA